MNEIKFCIDKETGNLIIDCDGITADLETHLGLTEMIRLRELNIDPLIIIDKIFEAIKKNHPKKEEQEYVLKEYDEIFGKIITFFGHIFQSSAEYEKLQAEKEAKAEQSNPDPDKIVF